jgi:hypothetical protein
MAQSRPAAGASFGRRKRLKSRVCACVPSDPTQAVAAMSMGNFRRYRAGTASVKLLKMPCSLGARRSYASPEATHCVGQRGGGAAFPNFRKGLCHVARNCKNAPVRACCCSLFEKHFARNYQICCNNDNASGCAGTLGMAEISPIADPCGVRRKNSRIASARRRASSQSCGATSSGKGSGISAHQIRRM